jgi:hypothetical protein
MIITRIPKDLRGRRIGTIGVWSAPSGDEGEPVLAFTRDNQVLGLDISERGPLNFIV